MIFMVDFSDPNWLSAFSAIPDAVGALVLFGMLAIVGLSIAIIMYLLGAFLMNDKLKAWGKNEFFELFYSAVIFVLIIAFIPLVDGAIKSIFVSSDSSDAISKYICDWDKMTPPVTSPYYNIGSCHIRLSIYFLHSIFNEGSNVGKIMYARYLYTSMLADLSITVEFITEMAGFFTYQPIRGFFTMGNTITVLLFDWLIKLMIATKFQEIFIVFIERALFMYLLVIGVILRVFAFTRRLGGLLIAMALAFFFVYPMFYAFGAIVINSIKTEIKPDVKFETASEISVISTMYVNGTVPMPVGDALDLKTVQKPSLDIWGDIEEIKKTKQDMEKGEILKDTAGGADLFNPKPPDDDSLFNIGEKAFSWFYGLFKKKLSDNLLIIVQEQGGPIDAVARVAFFSAFFGLVAIMSTIAAIRSISIVMGGDIEIAGLTHLI